MNTSTTHTDQSERRRLGAGDAAADANTCFYELGQLSFGRYGDVGRQSAQIKLVVHTKLSDKAKQLTDGA